MTMYSPNYVYFTTGVGLTRDPRLGVVHEPFDRLNSPKHLSSEKMMYLKLHTLKNSYVYDFLWQRSSSSTNKTYGKWKCLTRVTYRIRRIKNATLVFEIVTDKRAFRSSSSLVFVQCGFTFAIISPLNTNWPHSFFPIDTVLLILCATMTLI